MTAYDFERDEELSAWAAEGYPEPERAAAATEMDDWYCGECDDYFPVDEEHDH